MDGKNPEKEINDIRALLSMDPDDPQFKAAWRRFQDKRGSGGLITPRIVASRAKVEVMLCAELLVDILKGCREVSMSQTATPAERNKAAELALMLLKAHNVLDERLNALLDWKKEPEKKAEEIKEEPKEGETSQVPRFYVQKSG